MNAGEPEARDASSASALVVTGGSGFVGQRFLRALSYATPPRQVVVLGRQQSAQVARDPWPVSWSWATADLASDRSGAIAGWPQGATVVHLAAATGRAPREVHWAVNVEGTRRMLAAARACGARHFIFVSSVAAGYTDRRWYHYAESKRAAEALVRASGVPWTIVRPTMIFGHGSPNQRALEGLACGPLPVMLGHGRGIVQPIHVDDVSAALMRLVRMPPLEEVTCVGGRDQLAMRDLLAAMRQARGLAGRRVVPIPLGSLRAALGVLEPLLGRFLPVSAGQLAAFVNDAVSEPSAHAQEILPAPKGLAEMLAASSDGTT
jgi:nucleoside-diphosphate-sugar epimerase